MHPAIPRHRRGVQDLTIAARTLGVERQIAELGGPDEFENAFAAMTRTGAGHLVPRRRGVGGAYGGLHRASAEAPAPREYPWRNYVDAGGLMSYGARRPDAQRRIAFLTKRFSRSEAGSTCPSSSPCRSSWSSTSRPPRPWGSLFRQRSSSRRTRSSSRRAQGARRCRGMCRQKTVPS